MPQYMITKFREFKCTIFTLTSNEADTLDGLLRHSDNTIYGVSKDIYYFFFKALELINWYYFDWLLLRY
ncbi:hypothetical protein HanIR_Chr12g0590141 [Helianthus annuus]|nr:hypothetical protein HanIR_Chr12g0590141 [Helianthus annuus]